ncbi:hypothetical protein fugu_020038 [Takifugu bimaculatus]|uniref:Chorein N-terminal domain-containing protein n=1 Tax=Takifugu bimaculatus TaxID=433685 RepID=A0A4Z2BIV3_9TELE|nr:hypothetical protein fugu_020038 [Takifugu bimaculatus]
MAGLIKKQILKHLSRFAKDLSPDQINLSTAEGGGSPDQPGAGQGGPPEPAGPAHLAGHQPCVLQQGHHQDTMDKVEDTSNLFGCDEKQEIVTRFTRCCTLDKVEMEMSTCDEPRPPNGPSPIATASGQSEYGFAEKVVEGMSLSINSIIIKISAKAFNASFELSQLQVYSVNTSWSVSDLRFTRIQDPQRGEILTFKEISWQMIRIEADAIQSVEHEMLSAPIRLITNMSKIRVTLKRRIKDCNCGGLQADSDPG